MVGEIKKSLPASVDRFAIIGCEAIRKVSVKGSLHMAILRKAFGFVAVILGGLLCLLVAYYILAHVLPGLIPIVVGFIIFAPTIYYTRGAFLKEAAPYPSSRFAASLMVGVYSESLFDFLMSEVPLYRSIVYALSVAAGYIAWRLLETTKVENAPRVPTLAGYLVGIFGAICGIGILTAFFPPAKSFFNFVFELIKLQLLKSEALG